MPSHMSWKSDPEEPTEEETLSDAGLIEGARGGDKKAMGQFREREFRRRSGLPGRYEKIVTQDSSGKKHTAFVMDRYSSYRRSPFGKGWIVGSCFAVAIACAFFVYSMLVHPSEGLRPWEYAADLWVVAGTFFTARGAFLGVRASRWLRELARQHELALNEQINPRRSEVTRQLMKTLDSIKAELLDKGDISVALDKARNELSDNLKTSTSGFSQIHVLTNLEIAELFLDSSSGAVLGGVLIAGGTLALAVMALHGQ